MYLNKQAFLTLAAFLALGFITLGVIASPGNNKACAAALPPTACDPEYMDALESRAWLEAQREITQNQNLIAKPDSVLEYTCFNNFLNHLSRDWGQGRLFSQTAWFSGRPAGIDDRSTDEALEEVVRKAMRNYLSQNFNHYFVGGRLTNVGYTDVPGNTTGGAVTDHDNYPSNGTPDWIQEVNDPNLGNNQKDYGCDMMAKVWEMARCMNFLGGDREDQDGFKDFAWYDQNDDPRNLPDGDGWAVCAAPASTSGASNIRQAMDSAFNQDSTAFTFESLPNQDNDPFADTTEYQEDEIETHLDKVLPPGAPGGPQNCGGGHHINTGLMVRRDGTPYAEVICTNPGCAQAGTAASCN